LEADLATVKRLSFVLAAIAVSFAQSASAQTQRITFTNATLNPIPQMGQATTYPEQIAVSGVSGAIYHVSVGLNITHTFPADLDILLVGPSGAVMLMSDAGSSVDLTNSLVTFDDCATRLANGSVSLAGGRFRPTNIAISDTAFPAPAPAAPYANNLATFNGLSPNGTWSLYVVDDAGGDQGSIDSFSLTFFTDATNPLATGRNPIGCTGPDYDGDGRADVAVFRETTGDWFISRSGSNGALMQATWGNPALGDIQAPADYDGDGITDIAIYRQSTGEWFARRSSDLTLYTVPYGAPASTGLGDTPVPADYDGDGTADLAIYRTTTGQWFIRFSSGKTPATIPWGFPPAGDKPARR
jgi:subtilisin-like proprotein convertase family protein